MERYEKDERSYRLVANLLLIASVLGAAVCEGKVIWGLWIHPSHDYAFTRFSLPLFVGFPLCFLVVLRTSLKGWIKDGTISRGLAANIGMVVGGTVMLAYACIEDLARLAF
jgi:hypothetical protein